MYFFLGEDFTEDRKILMAKKDIGFRFSEETHAQLLDLSGRWGCTRTEVIEALVREAVRAVDAEQPPSVQISEYPAEPKVLPKDPKEVAKAVRPPVTRGATLTGRPHGPVPKGKK